MILSIYYFGRIFIENAKFELILICRTGFEFETGSEFETPFKIYYEYQPGIKSHCYNKALLCNVHNLKHQLIHISK